MSWATHAPRRIVCARRECGITFESSNPNAKFCSPEHRSKQARSTPGYKSAQKKFIASTHGKKARAIAVANHRDRFPEREAARAAVKNAIKRGELKPQPCRDCGDPKSEAHHPDYSKPLEVVWLCKPHHRIEDRKRRAA